MKINTIENGKVIEREMTVEEQTQYVENAIQDTRTYAEKVNDLIRERYSIADELAILRQKEVKQSEYQEYYAYCESCKQRAREN